MHIPFHQSYSVEYNIPITLYEEYTLQYGICFPLRFVKFNFNRIAFYAKQLIKLQHARDLAAPNPLKILNDVLLGNFKYTSLSLLIQIH